MFYEYWASYVSQGEKLALLRMKLAKSAQKGLVVQPIEAFRGRISQTFWGRRWCDHIEKFQSLSNRLPRGVRYLRNGSVGHLEIDEGKVFAWVAGSEAYQVHVNIKTLPRRRWIQLKKDVTGHVGSLFELLRGDFSETVMNRVADAENGLFPRLGEMTFTCSCPDAWGGGNWMCKHIAAVFYGIGRRLDTHPELLFRLRGVDHRELIGAGADEAVRRIDQVKTALSDAKLSEMFGIDIASSDKRPERPIKKSAKGAPKTKTTPKTKTAKITKTAKAAKTSGINKSNKAIELARVTKTVRVAKPTAKKPTGTTTITLRLTPLEKTRIQKSAALHRETVNDFLLIYLSQAAESPASPKQVRRKKKGGRPKKRSAAPPRREKLKGVKRKSEREEKILIRLQPALKKRLALIAADMGVRVPLYAHYAIFE